MDARDVDGHASMRIDRCGWQASVAAALPQGLLAVPLLAKANDALDAYQLLGRRVCLHAGLRFGALGDQGFILMDEACYIVKGNRKR